MDETRFPYLNLLLLYFQLYGSFTCSLVSVCRPCRIIGGSCYKYHFCRDKKHVFVASKHVFCRDKSMLRQNIFVTTKIILAVAPANDITCVCVL